MVLLTRERGRETKDRACARPMFLDQLTRPGEISLRFAFHKPPMKASDISVSQEGKVRFNQTVDMARHPFGTQHRSVVLFKRIVDPLERIQVAVSVKRNQIRVLECKPVNIV